MKLNISPRVEKHLLDNGIIDDDKVWSYAHIKAVLLTQEGIKRQYGFALVCVNQDELFIYDTEINSNKLDLKYKSKITELEKVNVKKIFWGLRTVLSFSKGEEYFELEMDEWKRFSALFM